MKNAVFSNLIEFEDIYFISQIIKKINNNYRLYFNTKENRYEVHDISKPRALSLCLASKIYPDERMILKLIKTRKENMNKLFRQIENENAKVLENHQCKICNIAKDQLSEVINYSLTKPTHDLSKEEIKKIINNEEIK